MVALCLLVAWFNTSNLRADTFLGCKFENGSSEPLFNNSITYLKRIKNLNQKIRKNIKIADNEKIVSKLLKQVKKLKRRRSSLLPRCKDLETPAPLPTNSPTVEPTKQHEEDDEIPPPTITPAIPYTMDVVPTYKQYGNSSSCNPNQPFIRATADEINAAQNRLLSLNPSPRLLVPNSVRFDTLANLRTTDSTLNGYLDRMLLHITYNLNPQAIPTYTSDAALLSDGRTLESFVMHYALAYRLTGNNTYLNRAKGALLSAVDNFPSWGIANNTLHVASSFVVAVAVGRDWLSDFLTSDEKSRIRLSMLTKFANPVLNMYRTGCKDAWSCESGETHFWWQWSAMNIGLVSHSASILGALSLAETDLSIASEILANGVIGLQSGLKYFSADGAGCEGPDYQGYALRFAIYALTSLDGALGESFGLWEKDGLSSADDYLLDFGGGHKKVFNFGDATVNGKRYGELQAIIKRHEDPLALAILHDTLKERAPEGSWTRVTPETILFYEPALPDSQGNELLGSSPSSRMYLSSNEVSFEPPNGDGKREIRVAIVGGVNKWNHKSQGHLGSIIAYVDDAPLIKDYGYIPTSHFAGNTLGHSTLAFNETIQGESEKMGIIKYSPHPRAPFAILEHLGESSLVSKWLRGVQVGPEWILIRDEVSTKSAGTVIRWSIQTDAEVSFLDGGKSVKLLVGGKTYRGEVIEPQGALFSYGPINLADGETLDPANKRLSIALTGTGSPQSIEVTFFNETLGARPNAPGSSLQAWLN